MTARTRRNLITLAVTAAALTAGTAAAGDDRWHLQLSGVWVEPSLDASFTDSEGIAFKTEGRGRAGGSLSLEYLVSKRIGIGVTVLHAEPRTRLTGPLPYVGPRTTLTTDLTFRPILAGVSAHLTPDRPFDLQAGLVAGRVTYGDLCFCSCGSVVASARVKSGFTWGARVGADLRLGTGRWSVNTALMHLRTDLDAENGDEHWTFGYNPTIFSLGLGLHF